MEEKAGLGRQTVKKKKKMARGIKYSGGSRWRRIKQQDVGYGLTR